MDQVVLRGCEADLGGGGLSQEDLGAQMQAAGQEGDMAELQRLSQMVSTTGFGAWDGWIACLGELEEAGCQTLITVDLRP